MVIGLMAEENLSKVKISAEVIKELGLFEVAVANIKITSNEDWSFRMDIMKIIKTDKKSCKIFNKATILTMRGKIL